MLLGKVPLVLFLFGFVPVDLYYLFNFILTMLMVYLVLRVVKGVLLIRPEVEGDVEVLVTCKFTRLCDATVVSVLRV